MRARLREDVDVALERDPAATCAVEVLFYPYLHAIWIHRLSHKLYEHNRKVIARVLSLLARFASSGIDIHPGARIGRRFFIDHGASVVIGETAVIGNDVTLYHNVTLGSLGWWRDQHRQPGEQRHPTVGDNVVIGANSSVLGPVTIGACSKVGAHSLVLQSVPPDSAVRAIRATIMSATDDGKFECEGSGCPRAPLSAENKADSQCSPGHNAVVGSNAKTELRS